MGHALKRLNAEHYLDDFILFGCPPTDECLHSLQIALSCCTELGWEAHKVGGPASCITFLGIEIDTTNSQLRLPSDRLRALKGEIGTWDSRRSCTKKQLLSLIGQLSHTSKVIKPGRSFLCRLIHLSSSASQLHHHIRLNTSARADIQWWFEFMEDWNGSSFFIPPAAKPLYLHTDASGSWGCGAVWSNSWFQYKWPDFWSSVNIAVKEFLPIVIAAATWGRLWSRAQVIAYSDNMAVVQAVKSRSVKCPKLMRFLRALFLIEDRFNFSLNASHIVGHKNVAADSLSRNNVHEFFSVDQQANPIPTPLLQDLLQLLLNQQAN